MGIGSEGGINMRIFFVLLLVLVIATMITEARPRRQNKMLKPKENIMVNRNGRRRPRPLFKLPKRTNVKRGSGTKALLSRLSNKMTKLAATEEKKDGERHNQLITKIDELSAKMDELQMTVENAAKAKQDVAHQEVHRSPRSPRQDDTDDGSGGSGGSDPMEDPMYGFGSGMVSGTPPPRDPRKRDYGSWAAKDNKWFEAVDAKTLGTDN